MLKTLASHLSPKAQQTLKRLHFGWLIRKGVFTTAEEQDTEFPRLAEWVRAGDWVLDVGANVGNYTARLSELVGPSGRVISIEPVPETFELLVANLAQFPFRNVTFLNVAASAETALHGMTAPILDSGLENRYMAHLSEGPCELSVMSLAVDALALPQPVRLVKVDVEGHELVTLRGMEALLRRDQPVLIVEGHADDVSGFLAGLGYRFEERQGSPNRVFTPQAPARARTGQSPS